MRSPETARILQSVFKYVFDEDYKYGGIAKVELREITEPFELLGMPVIPVPVMHGDAEIFGYRVGRFAYLTDFSSVPDSSIALLQGVELVFLDALRHEPHPTHSTVENSLKVAARIGAAQTLLHSHQPRPGARGNKPDTSSGSAAGLRRIARRDRPGELSVQVFESLEEMPRNFGPAVVSVGNYDGIHCAHQRLIQSICARAKELHARAVLVTFDPHPERILHPHGGPPLITPMARKLELLSRDGAGRSGCGSLSPATCR